MTGFMTMGMGVQRLGIMVNTLHRSAEIETMHQDIEKRSS